MNRRSINPFAPIESRSDAEALQKGSTLAFALWSVAMVAQAGAITAGLGSGDVEARGATAGYAVFLAVVSAFLALVQWRKPGRILPALGLAWSMFDLSSILVAIMVGAPTSMGEVPVWVGVLMVVVAAACGALHIGSLRSAIQIGKFI